MKILVTGATGFLGWHIAEELWSHYPNDQHCWCSSGTDLTNKNDTIKLFRREGPEIVIHAAGKVGGIEANSKYPADFFYQNLMMGVNVIEACRVCRVKKLIQIGSVCEYPKLCPTPFQEENLWSGAVEETNMGYGMSKKILLTMLEVYRKQYGLNGIHLLVENMYGPRDNFSPESSHVIPALIRKTYIARRTGNLLQIFGTGKPTREFLYVADCARAIRLAIENYNEPEPINIGSGEEISISNLARKIADMMGLTGGLCFDDSKPDGQQRRQLDVQKAANKLGFYSTTKLDEGLQKTIQWFYESKYAKDLP